jgi:hypothetical protein
MLEEDLSTACGLERKHGTKKVVLRTTDAIDATWKFDLNRKSHEEIPAREYVRIRRQYWNLIRELEKSEDEKLPTNKEVKSFVETIIKKEYMTEKLDCKEREALESFKQTARVVSVVGDSLWHLDNQIGEYGDIKILANYLYRHVWIPAFRLRIPVDMLAVMFDLYYENLLD